MKGGSKVKIDKKKLQLEMARQCIGLMEIAQRADMPYITVRTVASGRNTVLPRTAGMIAKALGVDVSEIII